MRNLENVVLDLYIHGPDKTPYFSVLCDLCDVWLLKKIKFLRSCLKSSKHSFETGTKGTCKTWKKTNPKKEKVTMMESSYAQFLVM